MASQDHPISEYHLNKNQPDKPQFAIYELHDYLEKNGANTTRPHIHSYYQIIWFLSGSGVHFVDFRSFEVKSDSIFFIDKNQVHYFDEQNSYEGYLLHFNESFLVQSDSEMEFFLKFNFFGNPYQSPVSYLSSTCHEMLETYVSQIKTELRSDNPMGREELLRGYLKAFLIQVQRLKNNSDLDVFVTDERRRQLLKYINIVDRNFKKGLTVNEYAKALNISSRTLSDITGQLINKTPLQIIQERINLEAQRLLLHSELNVNQIGYRLGFDDPSYFVKYFKKHTGQSPSDFRRSVS